jgi:hypothetical protein
MLASWSSILRASCSSPHQHRIHGSEEEGAELVCATVEFGIGMLNPLIASLPEPFVLPLDALSELAPSLELLFSEASSELPGRQTALDRLFEYVLVLGVASHPDKTTDNLAKKFTDRLTTFDR